MSEPTLDGRLLQPADHPEGGEVDVETMFEFRQQGDLISATYKGGAVRLGFLVGVRSGDRLEFRYVQVNREGEISSGRSSDRIEILSDGRVRLHETWVWESRQGSGTSTLEEIDAEGTHRRPTA